MEMTEAGLERLHEAVTCDCYCEQCDLVSLASELQLCYLHESAPALLEALETVQHDAELGHAAFGPVVAKTVSDAIKQARGEG